MKTMNEFLCVMALVQLFTPTLQLTWHCKARYAVQYGVPYSSVTKAERPRNCEFFTAPLGDKACHYDAEVSTIRTATSTEGKPIVSFDDGKNWVLNDGPYPVQPGITVAWKRIEEGD